MEKLMAYCGLICTDCGAYIATQNNDDKKRQEIAAQWTKEYNHEFKVEDINCDGCTSGGRVIGYSNICPIRKCARAKNVKNCGWCDDYPCSGLDEMFKTRPDAKKTLDGVNKRRKS